MYLIVNLGSASKKYAFYDGGKRALSAHFERAEGGGFIVALEHAGKEEQFSASDADYRDSVKYVLRYAILNELLSDNDSISAVGMRIVAPGKYFTEHKKIDKEYVKRLKSAEEIVPLHIKPVLAELKSLRDVLPVVPIIGASDSAYHYTMPEVARRYAIPEDMANKYEVYRYGYHGLSVASAVSKLRALPGGIPKRAVVCHLGGGASITALREGVSIDTSMGFSPLEGVPMGSRSGNIDAGAVLYLAKSLGYSPDKLFKYLNTEAGLVGLSGGVSDIRELLALSVKGNRKAEFALDIFIYRIRQYIGAYMAVLGGIDCLVFTGAIGERAPKIRRAVCENLNELGIVLNESENSLCADGKEGNIADAISHASIHVLKADEMSVMAQITNKQLTINNYHLA